MPTTSSALDLLIRGGSVVDGTRSPRFEADVGVAEGRIAAIGDLSGRRARRTIDATGKVVSPGFIDAHTHDDLAVVTQPEVAFKVSQGVTTVVTGNCGISVAPLRPDTPLPMPLGLMDAPAHQRFGTFAAYLDALRRAPASVNVAPLVGHTTLRVVCMPDLGRPADGPEITAMRVLLEEALEAGAIGVSTGTFYPPAASATTEEIIEVCRPLARRAGVFATHMRDESDHVIESLEETFRIGRELGVPVVISHHKTSMARNFGKSEATLALIRAAMSRQRVCLDCYPYTAGSTMIRTDRGMLDMRVVIADSRPHPECAGRDLDDIAREWGVSRVQACERLQPGSAIYFMMDEGDVRRILAFDETMVGSDGIPSGEKPHPRLWGTFPRVLGHYSRDLGLFPLETAVWKMTGLTARNFGLQDRGLLREGASADIVVFDPASVVDTATYESPTRPARGIDAVIVNGAVTWHDGRHTGARGGQVVRRVPQAGA